MIRSKKGQSWYIDFIISIVIFGAAIFLFMKYFPLETNMIGDTVLDGEVLSDILTSEGIPASWDGDNVIQVGLMTNNSIDESKWANLSAMDYAKIKSLLPIRSDFIAYVKKDGSSISIAGNEYVGKPGINETNIVEQADPDEIVAVDRLVVFKGHIVELNIMVWSDQ